MIEYPNESYLQCERPEAEKNKNKKIKQKKNQW